MLFLLNGLSVFVGLLNNGLCFQPKMNITKNEVFPTRFQTSNTKDQPAILVMISEAEGKMFCLSYRVLAWFVHCS